MLIVPATVADLPALVLRWQELMDHHRALDPVLYATLPSGANHYRAFLRRHIDDSRGLVLVAPEHERAEGGDLLGYVVATHAQRAPHFALRDVGLIHDLAVRPDARGQGVGRALVAAACQRLRARGLRLVLVNYAPGNLEARGFWPRLGFQSLLTEAFLRI